MYKMNDDYPYVDMPPIKEVAIRMRVVPETWCVAAKIWMLRGICPRCKSLSVNSARDANEDELFRYCAFCRYDGPIDIIFEYIIQKTDWKECDMFGNVS